MTKITKETSQKGGPPHEIDQTGLRLRWARERSGLSQAQLGEKLGVSQAAVDQAERGLTVKPKFLPEAAEILDVPYNWIVGKAGFHEVLQAELTARVFIAEVNQSGNETANWSIPPHATGLPPAQNKNLEIREVVGDSMAPEFRSGDFVLVNTADTSPSPAGLFMIHDGHGLTLRRVEPLPSGNLRLSASNPAYSPMEAAKTDVRIYGRIVLKIARV